MQGKYVTDIPIYTKLNLWTIKCSVVVPCEFQLSITWSVSAMKDIFSWLLYLPITMYRQMDRIVTRSLENRNKIIEFSPIFFLVWSVPTATIGVKVRPRLKESGHKRIVWIVSASTRENNCVKVYFCFVSASNSEGELNMAGHSGTEVRLPYCYYKNAFRYCAVRITEPSAFNWLLFLNLNIVMGEIAWFLALKLRLEVILLSER
jgi:hypothetical protein